MTNWRFVVRDNPAEQPDWLIFEEAAGCASFVGRLGHGGQTVSVNSAGCTKARVMHEVMHALGVWHEQSR